VTDLLSSTATQGQRELPDALREIESSSLREAERRYREVLNALPAAVYTTDAQGRVTFYNEACVALSGRRPKLGTDEWCVTWRLYWPDGAPMPHDTCPMAVALKEGREIRGAEAIAERPDGTRIVFTPYPTLLRNEAGEVVGAINMLVDITERKAAEDRQRLLANEVNHRANNLLTVVQAMLRMTEGQTVAEFKQALNGRIKALAHAHGLLARSRWHGADLQHLIGEELAAHIGGDLPRVWISGASLALEAAAAQSMAMILHELATNAEKHGALSGARGRVLVEWRHDDAMLSLRWTEQDGPPASQPEGRAVGFTVIERAAGHLQGRATWDWRPEGLVFSLVAPISGLVVQDG